jgi:hypothetical protein
MALHSMHRFMDNRHMSQLIFKTLEALRANTRALPREFISKGFRKRILGDVQTISGGAAS